MLISTPGVILFSSWQAQGSLLHPSPPPPFLHSSGDRMQGPSNTREQSHTVKRNQHRMSLVNTLRPVTAIAACCHRLLPPHTLTACHSVPPSMHVFNQACPVFK